MGNWLTDNLPSVGGIISDAVGKSETVQKAKDAVSDTISGAVDSGVKSSKDWYKGMNTETAVEKAAAELRTVGANGINVGIQSTSVGKLIQAAVDAGDDGQVGPGSIEKINEYLVNKFAPKAEEETSGFGSMWKSVTSVGKDDPLEKYPELAKQVQHAIAVHEAKIKSAVDAVNLGKDAKPEDVEAARAQAIEEVGPIQVISDASEITGSMIALMCEDLCKKDAFDGNDKLTQIAGQAFGEVAATAGNNYQYLQGLGNQLAPNDVAAPTGDFKPVSPENMEAPTRNHDASPMSMEK